MKNKQLLAKLSLVLVAIIWGVTFILVKQALNDAPPFSFATLRFGIAFILTLLLINKKNENYFDKKELLEVKFVPLLNKDAVK